MTNSITLVLEDLVQGGGGFMHSHTCIHVCMRTLTHMHANTDVRMNKWKHSCKHTIMHIHMQACNTHAHIVGDKVLLPQHTWTVYMVPGSKPLINCSWDEAGVSIVWEVAPSALAVIWYRTAATSSNTSLGGNQVALSACVPKLTTDRLAGGSGTADKQRHSHSSVITRTYVL